MDDEHVTNKDLQLELKATKSELKSDYTLKILAAIALQNFLLNVQIPPAIAVAVPGFLLVGAKVLIAISGR